jgi:cyclopropane-fatty-acyl-phospholipid synthase
MFEHVGIKHYPEFFQQVEKLLKPAGAALLHAIGRRDGRATPTPGSASTSSPAATARRSRKCCPGSRRPGSGSPTSRCCGLHYAETIKHWRANFEKHRAEIKALYDERFCRMWEFYLIGSELSFRYDYNMVFQIQMARGINTVPITRDYMFDWERMEAARDFPPVPWKEGRAAE